MGMPCEVNSILKLTPSQGYPEELTVGERCRAEKSGYRIVPIDVPIMLVDADWMARADVVIETLTWSGGVTRVEFTIARLYETPVLCH
jgi:hypothetical protein